jgi:hypothetical protein
MVKVVRKWKSLSDELRAARANTLQYCEARPSKGDSVTLAVVDKEGFSLQQALIVELAEDLAKIEDVIRKMDALSNGSQIWYSDLSAKEGSLEGVEDRHRRQLQSWAALAMTKSTAKGATPEEILIQDEQYQKVLKAATEDTEAAKKDLELLKPKLDSLRALLEAAEC